MKTNQVMESIDRELCGCIVRQRTKDSFMNLDDIVNIVYQARINNGLNAKGFNFSNWITNENTQEFLEELEKEIGTKPYIRGAKNRSGWIHPFFAVKILTHFNPKFEIQVYKWLWDYLIQNRISSGDSYNTMCGVLWKYASRKDLFAKNIKNLATIIKKECGVDDWNTATQEQLADREYLHNMIADLTSSLQDSKAGASLAIRAYKEKKDRVEK